MHANPWRDAVDGYCGATEGNEGTACGANDVRGTFLRAVTWKACYQRCPTCNQCTVIPFSPNAGGKPDCTWFAECDLLDLEHTERLGHRTLRVRNATALEFVVSGFVESKNT